MSLATETSTAEEKTVYSVDRVSNVGVGVVAGIGWF